MFDPKFDPLSLTPEFDPMFDPNFDNQFDPMFDPKYDHQFDPNSDPKFDPKFDPKCNGQNPWHSSQRVRELLRGKYQSTHMCLEPSRTDPLGTTAPCYREVIHVNNLFREESSETK